VEDAATEQPVGGSTQVLLLASQVWPDAQSESVKQYPGWGPVAHR
jgi:hypothetical protein